MNVHKPRQKASFGASGEHGNEFEVEHKLRDKLVKMQKSDRTRVEAQEPPRDAEPQSASNQQSAKAPKEADATSLISSKIRDAMTLDIDPEKSLAAMRAILVGPMRQLHDARVEELVSILEENERTVRASLNTIEIRLGKITTTCDTLISASEDTLRKLQEQSVHVEFEMQKLADGQQSKLETLAEKQAAYETSTGMKLEQVTGEIGQMIEDLRKKSATDFDRLQTDMTARIQNLMTAGAEAELVARQLDARVSAMDVHAEKLNRRNAEVFSKGFSDLAERFLNMRSVHID